MAYGTTECGLHEPATFLSWVDGMGGPVELARKIARPGCIQLLFREILVVVLSLKYLAGLPKSIEKIRPSALSFDGHDNLARHGPRFLTRLVQSQETGLITGVAPRPACDWLYMCPNWLTNYCLVQLPLFQPSQK